MKKSPTDCHFSYSMPGQRTMRFIADLHIHSRFSLATSKALTIPHLADWAMRKGINILGTGDFTHPAWLAELRENLQFDEDSGLYKPCRIPEKTADSQAPSPLLCLQTEISCIYKRHGKVRKVHNLIFMPHLDAAAAFADKLAQRGNINSDGRPILGIDSHDLLEMALETSAEAVLIPAHIWTPWFSLFGAKSGFDSLEDCYGDLSSHIFALETGLSSDPPMNRLWSRLDQYALISNSDAHSGSNLGREANLFSGKPSYSGIFQALRRAASRKTDAAADCAFLGTLEFYPEEGKYHYDGHRACGISLTPEESRRLNNLCPVCHKLLTMGVLHRIMDLADREEAPALAAEPSQDMIIPLAEVVAQCLGTSHTSKKTAKKCAEIIQNLGPELNVLSAIPISRISEYWDTLGEAILRLRSGKIDLSPGFDGQYGKITIFDPREIPQSTRKK